MSLSPAVTYLSSLPDPGGATTGPIWISGKSYPNSVYFDGLALDTKQETFDYDLSSGNYHTFTATVALISNGGQRDPQAIVLFQVQVNGRTVASVSCTRYASHSIRVSISGASQLTLQAAHPMDGSQQPSLHDGCDSCMGRCTGFTELVI